MGRCIVESEDGCIRKGKNQKLRFSAGLFLAVLLFCIAGAVVFHLISSPKAGAVELAEWEYSCGNRLTGAGTRIVNGQQFTADATHPVKPCEGEYIVLEGTLPAGGERVLCVKTENSMLRVDIAGQRQYDTFHEGKEISGIRLNTIHIPASFKEQIVTIVMFSPLQFDFSAYLLDSGSFSPFEGIGKLPYADIFAAIFFVLLSGYISVNAFRQAGKREGISLFRRGLLAAISLLCSFGILCNPAVSQSIFGSGPMLYQCTLFMQAALTLFILLSLLYEQMVRNSLKKLIAANLLFAVLLIGWPYQVLFAGLVKAGFLLQLWNLIYIAVFAIRNCARLQKGAVAAVLVFEIVCTLYWYFMASHGMMDLSMMMYFAASGYTIWTFRSWNTGKAGRKRKAAKKAILKRKRSREVISASLPANLCLPDNLRKESEELWNMQREDRNPLLYQKIEDHLNIEGELKACISLKCDGNTHHLLHVAEYTYRMCLKMGMGLERAKLVADAALLHDIGKLYIDDAILMKKTALTQHQFQEIRNHHIYGYDILNDRTDDFSRLAAAIAREHHEHFDGSGYLGLSGEEICLESRIVAVADVFDALTMPRVYKKTWGFEQTYAYITMHSGDFFDPDVVGSFTLCRRDLLKIYEINRQRIQNEDWEQQ